MESLLRKGYSGGEELRRAMAALAGPSGAKEEQKEKDGQAPQPVPLPIQILETTDLATRELAYAAQRYGRAAKQDPEDFDAVYNYGLALQELALRALKSRQEQLRLLQQAADSYEAAWQLRQGSHAALYNWGVALSDLARVVKPSDRQRAHGFLVESARKYAMSLEWNPNNPQALNNWGLVLQELSTMRPPAEQAGQVQQSTAKFRRAIRLRPDFDRACYNLGTVVYAFACAQQSSLTQQLPSRLSQDPDRMEAEREKSAAVSKLFALAAQYIVLAHALQPGKDVYAKSLPVVRPLLPLPHLRAGALEAPLPETSGTCTERWQRQWFVLDERSFRSANPPRTNSNAEPDSEPSTSPRSHSSIHLEDILAAKTCLDPSLPDGHAFWLGLDSRAAGAYFVAESSEEAEGWVDALQLCSHLAGLRRLRALGEVLSPPDLSAAADVPTSAQRAQRR